MIKKTDKREKVNEEKSKQDGAVLVTGTQPSPLIPLPLDRISSRREREKGEKGGVDESMKIITSKIYNLDNKYR